MSARHPIIAITGSSGAGTTTVTTTFQQIFRREGVRAAIVHGDAFHRYDRDEMRVQRAKASLLPSEHPLAFDLAPPLRLGAGPARASLHLALSKMGGTNGYLVTLREARRS